jgi:peroxiredoxin
MIRDLHPLILAGVVLAIGVLSCSGCGPGGGSSAPAPVAGTKAAPEFTLPDIRGEQVKLADFAGKVLLVDFWATWCAPCKEEIPMFKELHQNYGEQGFAIIAISDENAEIVKQFVEAREIPYTNLVDPGEISQLYGVVSLPTAFLVDAEGKIVEEFRGTKPRRILETRIRDLLDLPQAG